MLNDFQLSLSEMQSWTYLCSMKVLAEPKPDYQNT